MKKQTLMVPIGNKDLRDDPKTYQETYYYQTIKYNGETFAVGRYINLQGESTKEWRLFLIPTGEPASRIHDTQKECIEEGYKYMGAIKKSVFKKAIEDSYKRYNERS